jgi:hypothetical protein
MKFLMIIATMLLMSCVSNAPSVAEDTVTAPSSETIISSSSVPEVVDKDLYIKVETNGMTTTYEKSYTNENVRYNDLVRYTKRSPYASEEFSTNKWSYVGEVHCDSAWTFEYTETTPVIIRHDSVFYLNDSLRAIIYPDRVKLIK